MRLINHFIRLDQNQKAKNFFVLEININAGGDQQSRSTKIILEKQYGEFKRLHQHLIDTYTAEIKEYERIEQLTSSGDLKKNTQVSITDIDSSFG